MLPVLPTVSFGSDRADAKSLGLIRCCQNHMKNPLRACRMDSPKLQSQNEDADDSPSYRSAICALPANKHNIKLPPLTLNVPSPPSTDTITSSVDRCTTQRTQAMEHRRSPQAMHWDSLMVMSPPASRQPSFNVPLHRLAIYDSNSSPASLGSLSRNRPYSPSDVVQPLSHRNLLKASLSPKPSVQDMLRTVDAETVAIGISPSTESSESDTMQ